MKYYNQIREQFINNKIYKKVKDYSKNKNDLETYYNVGKILIEAQGGEEKSKYGDKLIKEYSERLKLEFEKGYSVTNLKYMRQFYLLCKKSHAVRDQLTWTHYRELGNRIKNNEYQRLPNDTKNKMLINEESKVNDFIKNPIVIKNSLNYKDVSEKMLKRLILEDMSNFLKELGEGFSFIDNEYKIKIGNKYNYIDLLLFNYIYNCFVVVELKVTELKKEHIGQIQTYMNYIGNDRIFETEYIFK